METLSMAEDVNFTDIPQIGHHLPLDEFILLVNSKAWIDYDGHGYLATEHRESDLSITPSMIEEGYKPPKWCTHIVWYSR